MLQGAQTSSVSALGSTHKQFLKTPPALKTCRAGLEDDCTPAETPPCLGFMV